MLQIKKKISFAYIIACFSIFMAIFSACDSGDEDPDAQIPKIMSISTDVATVINVAKEISVGVEISDAGNLTYQWYEADTKLSAGEMVEDAKSAAFTPQTTKTGTYYYYCIITNRLGSSTRSVTSPLITYTVTEWVCAQKPVIARQPEKVTANFGTDFTLSTVAYPADNGTLSYQWYFSATEEGGATILNGATSAAYSGTVGSDTLGFYYCVITNTIADNGDGGEKTAAMRTAQIEVSSTQVSAKNPVILQQPQNVMQDFGNPFTFSVTTYSADGGSLSYQWYYKADKEGEANPLAEATKAAYAGTVSKETKGYYYCVITNIIADNGDGGTKSATVQTNTASLSNDTIEANEPVILTHPSNAELHVPEKVTFIISAYSADKGTLSYQWHKITGSTDTAIADATKSSYEATAETVGEIKYYCAITNTITDNGDGGAKSATANTNPATVTVCPVRAKKPVIAQQPENLTANFGTNFTLSTIAYPADSGTLSYQWYFSETETGEATALKGETASSCAGTISAKTTGYYYCLITNIIADNGDGGEKTADIKTSTARILNTQIKATEPVILQEPQGAKQDFGTSFSFNVTAYSADEGTLSYQWYYRANKDGTAKAIDGATKTAYAGKVSSETLGQYYCVVTNTIANNGDGGTKSAITTTKTAELSSTQIVAKSPVILQQPQNIKQDFGTDFSFSVTAYSADEGTLSYQWYYKTDKDGTAKAIDGAKSAGFTGKVSAETTGYYYCAITNTISDNKDGGAKTATIQTNTASLSNDKVEANEPVILTQPESASLHMPEKATLSVSAYSADKGTLSYQWHKKTGSTDTAIDGATEVSYVVSAESVGETRYYCVVTNTIDDNKDGGTKSATAKSETATVTVTQVAAATPLIFTQPESASLHKSEQATLSVSAYSPDEGNLSYQWHKKAGSTDTAIDGATEVSYVVSAESVGETRYYCVVTNTIADNKDGGAKSATANSDSATVTVNVVQAKKPVILTQPKDAVLHVSEKTTLSVTAYSPDEGNLSYQWHKKAGDTDSAIAGATKSTYEALAGSVDGIRYYCVVTNTITDNGDGGAKFATEKSDSAMVSVTAIQAQEPVIARQPEKLTATFGTPFSLSTTAYSADGGTLSFQWYFSATAIDEASALSGETATKEKYEGTIGADTTGYYYCVITNKIDDNEDGGTKTAVTKTNTVRISSTQIMATPPLILQQPQNVKQDFGNPFTFSVTAYSSDEGTLSYQWYYKTTEESTAKAIDGVNEASYSGTVGASTIGYYYCVVTNKIANNGDGGTKTATIQTNAVSLSNDKVVANKPVILTHPKNATLRVPEKTTLSVFAYSVDSGMLSYQWHKVEEETDTAIAGATEAMYEVTAGEVGEIQYYCVVTNTITDNGDGGTKSASTNSNAATVTVTYANAETPIITVQPDDTSAVIPAIKVFNVGAYSEDGGNLTYQWYSVAEGETEGTAIAGETKSKLIVTVRELGKTGYYCVVTNAIADNGDGGNSKTASVQTQTAWLDAIYLKNVISAPAFTTQPAEVNVAPYNQSIKIPCTAEAAEGTVSYRWYESADGTTAMGTAVSNATTSTLTTPKYTERGIHYFYCVATTVLTESDESVKSTCAISNVVSVAHTGLPVVYVDTPDSVAITSKEVWTENAKISLKGAKDSSWDFDEVATSIRGRGNTTWGYPKKPYALKLGKKQKIMGMPKHKRWVLIANYLDDSFMRNEMAFYLSKIFELDYTVRGKFVDFVLNGEYRGLYWLGEAIKPDENRVNINDGSESMTDDEDKDYLIEMDKYFDEPVEFKSSIRNMPYMIKNDDYMYVTNAMNEIELTSGGEARLNRLKAKITNLETLLYPDFTSGMSTSNCSAPDESYAEIIDIDSWAKFWFVNEIMDNGELGHPKSCYFTFDSTNNIFKAGPVWDFDWAALSQASSCRLKDTIYYNALFKSPAFKNRTKQLWSEYYSNIDIDSQIESMRREISLAAEYDAKVWKVNHHPYGPKFADFNGHVDFLNEILLKKLAVVNNEVNGL